jgi:hypothetical protein
MSHLTTSTFPGTYEILFDALDYEQAVGNGELQQGLVRGTQSINAWSRPEMCMPMSGGFASVQEQAYEIRGAKRKRKQS